MIIHQVINPPISTNTYLLTTGDHTCFVIDPFDFKVVEEELLRLSLKPEWIYLTHEHFDHIAAVNELKKKYGCKLLCSKICSERIVFPTKNLSSYFNLLLTSAQPPVKVARSYDPYHCEKADMVFEQKQSIQWNHQEFYLFEAPGHSMGSSCLLAGEEALFTGDSLLRDVPVITRLPGGENQKYNEFTVPLLREMPKNVMVYPGHGEAFVLKDSKFLWNREK